MAFVPAAKYTTLVASLLTPTGKGGGRCGAVLVTAEKAQPVRRRLWTAPLGLTATPALSGHAARRSFDLGWLGSESMGPSRPTDCTTLGNNRVTAGAGEPRQRAPVVMPSVRRSMPA